MKRALLIGGLLLAFLFNSCASIPAEAPRLSEHLGNEIQDLQSSHLALVHSFFDLKRKNIRNYLDNVWLPRYAENYFEEDDIKNMWNLVVEEGNSDDRTKFLLITGPEIQNQLNLQYQYMSEPLDELEEKLVSALLEKYSNTKKINTTLTSLLDSAAKISEKQQQYIEMIGITDSKVSNSINRTEEITTSMLNTAKTIDSNYEEVKENITNYKNQINNILKQI